MKLNSKTNKKHCEFRHMRFYKDRGDITFNKKEKWESTLTVCCHADSDAFLEATLLALVTCDFINDALALVLARVCRV